MKVIDSKGRLRRTTPATGSLRSIVAGRVRGGRRLVLRLPSRAEAESASVTWGILLLGPSAADSASRGRGCFARLTPFAEPERPRNSAESSDESRRRGPKAFLTTEHDHRRDVGSCPVLLDEQASPTLTVVLHLALLPGGDESFDVIRRSTSRAKTDAAKAAPAPSPHSPLRPGSRGPAGLNSSRTPTPESPRPDVKTMRTLVAARDRAPTQPRSRSRTVT